jgi:hypothetical protein
VAQLTIGLIRKVTELIQKVNRLLKSNFNPIFLLSLKEKLRVEKREP